MASSTSRFTSCPDGTICENSSPCLAHPTKESRYMCDCTMALGSYDNEKFAGIYCEHKATSYCQRSSFFCTNGGECRDYENGCKCPPNYEGHYCQFVKGARPSDWSSKDYMHPALIHSYYSDRGNNNSNNSNMSVGGILAIVAAVMVVLSLGSMAYVSSGKWKKKGNAAHEKEIMETMGSPTTTTTSPSDFVAGESVYNKKKKASSRFVTEDTLDADGGVLTAALEGGGDGMMGAVMEEVDLNDDDDDDTTTPHSVTNSGSGSPIGKKGEII